MKPLRTVRFQFDYNCPPLWLNGDKTGPWLVSSDGCFVGDDYSSEGEFLDNRAPDERLKGEFELERCVRLIYEIYCRIWDINEFPTGEPYVGFADEQEKKDFFDACDYVIKRMKEIFGDEFIVREVDERIIKERLWDCRKPK